MEKLLIIEGSNFQDIKTLLSSIHNDKTLIEYHFFDFKLNIFDFTEELKYTYFFLKKNNKLNNDYFLKKYYSFNKVYTAITINSNLEDQSNFINDLCQSIGQFLSIRLKVVVYCINEDSILPPIICANGAY